MLDEGQFPNYFVLVDSSTTISVKSVIACKSYILVHGKVYDAEVRSLKRYLLVETPMMEEKQIRIANLESLWV